MAPNFTLDEAKTLEDYRELGMRRMQVVQLRAALARYGQHLDWCRDTDGHACTCGLMAAGHIGSDAAAACGLTDDTGRVIADPQTTPPARPAGPWDENGGH